jgi:hypothetical protein
MTEPRDTITRQRVVAAGLIGGADYVLVTAAAEEAELTAIEIAFAQACATNAIAHLLLAANLKAEGE